MADTWVQTLLGGLWSLASFLVLIMILVTVHEYGHFWVARKVGVKVLRFSVGFGTALLRWSDKSGTEYVIAAIPFGGYVKMLDEREGNVAEADLPYSFNRQPVWKRMAIAVAGPLANLLLAFFVFWGLFLGGERGLAPIIGRVDAGSLAAVAGVQVGQEIVAVGDRATATRTDVFEALVGYMGDTGELILTVKYPNGQRQYDLPIDLQQWLADASDPDPVKALGLYFYQPPFVAVVSVVPDSAAARGGLLPQDVIERVNGETVEDVDSWVAIVRANPNKALHFGVRRGQHVMELSVTPIAIRDKQGNETGQIGAQVSGTPMPASQLRQIAYNPIESAARAAHEVEQQMHLLLSAVYKLIVGNLSPKNLSGPLGIAKVAGASAERGLAVFCQTLAILSISLGVMNLLPVPMLDGGHVVMYLVEMVKGRPLSEKVQMLLNQVGLVLIVSLMLFAVYNDALKI